MRYRLNGVHICYIRNDLLKMYRRIYGIDANVSNTEMVKEIIYTDIIQAPFEPKDVNADIRMLDDIAFYHGFKNPREFIEYAIHSRIEKKLFTCKDCNLCKNVDGKLRCMDEDEFYVYSSYCYCDYKGNGNFKPKEEDPEVTDLISGWVH